jgi:hypothetical protein
MEFVIKKSSHCNITFSHSEYGKIWAKYCKKIFAGNIGKNIGNIWPRPTNTSIPHLQTTVNIFFFCVEE